MSSAAEANGCSNTDEMGYILTGSQRDVQMIATRYGERGAGDPAVARAQRAQITEMSVLVRATQVTTGSLRPKIAPNAVAKVSAGRATAPTERQPT
jgi:hypothetical protein